MKLDENQIQEDEDKELCEMYNNLDTSQKRGIFPQIDEFMHLPSGTACKHYGHVFKKVLYPGKLSDSAKRRIKDEIR